MGDRVIRFFIVSVLAGLCLRAGAHEAVTGESVQRYLSHVAELQEALASAQDNAARAQASVRLGQTLDEIGELFNSDIEAHGKVQGLASSVLMSELAARGAPLAYSQSDNRFLANLRYYRQALQWVATGPVAAQASFELLRKQFYEAVGADPLRPVWRPPAQLAAQIRLGEALLRDFAQSAQREEVTFILAIHYMQSARLAGQTAARAGYLAKARALVAQFASAYPDSLRTPTLKTLLVSAELPG